MQQEIRNEKPRVTLVLAPTLKPSQSLAEELDFTIADDRLVGIVHGFAEAHPDDKVRLLSHDTGPMSTAKAVGVDYEIVPEAWLLPPETSDGDKRLKELESQIEKLRKAEPRVTVKCIQDGQEIDRLDVKATRYLPLADQKINDLLKVIGERYPLATQFEKESSVVKVGRGIISAFEEFVPASDEEIRKYQKSHDSWMKQCDAILRNLPEILEAQEGAAKIEFEAINNGTRPAESTLITFKALGKIEIKPETYMEECVANSEEKLQVKFPIPPEPPQGRYINKLATMVDVMGRLSNTHMPQDFSAIYRPNIEIPAKREDQFYYISRPYKPVQRFELQCKSWRHSENSEIFESEIHFDRSLSEVSGAVEFSIESSNLSQPCLITIPVRIVIESKEVEDKARSLVEKFVRRSLFDRPR